MSRRRSARRASAFLPVVLLCVACATTGPAPTTSPAPSAVAVATASPAAPTAGSAEPPRASLATEGGDPVDGQLGSYTWAGGGSDSPWLPGAPLRVGIGERLTLTLASGVGVADWTARRIPAASGGGPPDGSGAVALGGGAAPITFDAPAPGRWSVQVAVRFVDGLGSATYYWRLEVD